MIITHIKLIGDIELSDDKFRRVMLPPTTTTTTTNNNDTTNNNNTNTTTNYINDNNTNDTPNSNKRLGIKTNTHNYSKQTKLILTS